MNAPQRMVLFGMAVVFVLALLFPPFVTHHPYGTVNAGYAFILAPPARGTATVNVGMLLVEWIAVILVGVALVFAFRRNDADS